MLATLPRICALRAVCLVKSVMLKLRMGAGFAPCPAASDTWVTWNLGPPGSSPGWTALSVRESVLPFLSVTKVGKPAELYQKVTRSERVRAQNLGFVMSVVTERKYRWPPGGSNQEVVPSGLVTPVNVSSLPVPSTRLMNLLERPAMVSALLGWMSSGSPKRLRPEMESDQLLPAGESECSSRLL